ncbi:hypothetical protein [Marinibactrum halimedae]|uniref:Uncharacterized protein n=1 Tax=Marinibactrum halimedae TaxID=1444977 RepID=A0AA37T355_9GAMM|nr:hypothetical protein [Marinibactrum halimedae]MCD9459585.1 hypothetical protein [Marinibactrum halimedae]GLS25598.1 hypothetical protein GCM10007877_13120 [Marinibactrum halimedae]
MQASPHDFPISSSPAQLDHTLQKLIADYVKVYSWRDLAEHVAASVRRQYAQGEYLVEEGLISSCELEAHMKSQIPSRKYLQDFAKGRPICWRYTNTIANFFGHQYVARNYNPQNDLYERLRLTLTQPAEKYHMHQPHQFPPSLN